MNIKSLTALVGTLSLGALATGCASTKAAAPMEQGGGSSMSNAAAMPEKAATADCSGKPMPTAEKGAAHDCGGGGCGSSGCGKK
jgi:hypothetical protein